MKTFELVLFLFFAVCGRCFSQSDYLVKTTPRAGSTVVADEGGFVGDNFPYYSICGLTPGTKFMFVGEEKYNFIPVFKDANTDRDIENGFFQQKILEFLGNEEVSKESYTGTSTSTRFIFGCEGATYYHEVKNRRLNDICVSNGRAYIANLVYLADVDIARELLVGRIVYTRTTDVRVDDRNSRTGFRDVKIPLNKEVTVMAVGAGERQYPAKIVFDDKDGNSYYVEVAFSLTNSGLLLSDFTGAALHKYFSNAFSFENKELKTAEDARAKYINRALYPKRAIQVTKEGTPATLLRYTPLRIADLTIQPGTTIAQLTLCDREERTYKTDINLKYDVIIKNDNYLDDVFGFGDLRKQYPDITEANWALITNGEIKNGMTKDECRLALGSPVQIVKNVNSRYETWYYQGRVLDFEGAALLRIK